MSKNRLARRDWLKQTGVLASSTVLPAWAPAIFAQAELNALPRLALIIGNTRYSDAPLKNPVNDAKAIAAQLQSLGFKVSLQLDAGRRQMADAIEAYGDALAQSKGVGLFYYAGHGAQLAWRNYLIPVDAVIEKLDDMRDKTVELNALLQGLIKAKNPMNVIILDACRDNPFGTKVPTETKGLSQFDAPPGSILAYATAPGNTAADGEGANGLYTENLLREMKVPEAKIEDVFKRVRLMVRRRSEGAQIPWESTSLEDDFYFMPPKQATKLTEADLERQFAEELPIWEKIKGTKETEPLENYLRKYPSGKFAELAQFRLDRLLAEKEKARLEQLQIASKAERERLAREAETRRVDEEKRLAEERRAAEERRLAEEKRLAEERRRAEEHRRVEEQRIAKLAEERRRAEESLLAAELKAAEAKRLIAEKQLAEELRAAEEKLVAEEKRLNEERERARLARAEAEKQAKAALMPQVSIAANPFSKGTARADINYRVGDRYSYRSVDLLTRLDLGQRTLRVTSVDDDQVLFNDGNVITDLLGNIMKNPRGQTFVGRQIFVADYSIGKKWTTIYRGIRRDGNPDEWIQHFRVVARENITVPAGTFDAFKIEGNGHVKGNGNRFQITYWVAPAQLRSFIVFEQVQQGRGGKWIDADRSELVSFEQAG
jgi:uncharacterized caspase-like protein